MLELPSKFQAVQHHEETVSDQTCLFRGVSIFSVTYAARTARVVFWHGGLYWLTGSRVDLV